MPCGVACLQALVMSVCVVIVVSCAPHYLFLFNLVKESACVLQIFKRFHAAYVDAVCNPFYSVSMVRAGHSKLVWLHLDRVVSATDKMPFWSPGPVHATCSSDVVVPEALHLQRHAVHAHCSCEVMPPGLCCLKSSAVYQTLMDVLC